MMVRRETLEKPDRCRKSISFTTRNWTGRCVSANRAGTSHTIPAARYFHKESATTGQQSPAELLPDRNRLLFAWRNLRGGAAAFGRLPALHSGAQKRQSRRSAHRRGDLAKAMPGRTRLLHPEKQAGMTTLLEHSRLDFHLRTGTSGALSFRLRALLDAQNMDDYPQAKRRRKFMTLIPPTKRRGDRPHGAGGLRQGVSRAAARGGRHRRPAETRNAFAELRTLPIHVCWRSPSKTAPRPRR